MNALQNIHFSSCQVGFKQALMSPIDLTLEGGSLTCIYGQNGVGKTTLLKAIAGINAPMHGKVIIGGKDVAIMSQADISKVISTVFLTDVRIPNLTVRDFISFGRYPYTNWLGSLGNEDRQKVEEALGQCRLNHISDAEMTRLSDGERQKAFIARALAQDTQILLLDEPMSHLDIPNKAEIFRLLSQIHQRGEKTIIFTSHDLPMALQLADAFLVIHDQKVVMEQRDAFKSSSALKELIGSEVTLDPEHFSVRYKT